MDQRLHKATDTIRELVFYYVALLFISASVFSYAEGVDFIPALYWSAITSTSVGYGDISPKTILGMIDAVLTAVISLFVLVPLIVAKWLDYLACKRDHFSHEEQELIKNNINALSDKFDKFIEEGRSHD